MSEASARDFADREQWESIRFQARLLEAAGQAIVATDLSGVIVYWNRAAERMYGWSSGEVVGRTVDVLVSGELREQAGSIMAGLGRGDSWSGEFTLMHRNGEPLSVLVSDAPVYGGEGEMIGIVGVSTDITGRKRTEESLVRSEERLRNILETQPDCVEVLDGEGRILEMNPAGLEMIEADSLEQVRGLRVDRIVTSEHRDAFGALAEKVLRRGEPGTLEFEIIGLKGTRRWLEIHAVPLRSGRGETNEFLGLTRDITARKALKERLAHQAFHDPLTGLANWALFVDRLDHALARISRRDTDVAVLFAGLDNFETINDRFGHETGDRLLVSIAERLESCLRQEDTLARFGGDEFVILLEDVESPVDAARVAERIAGEIRKPFSLEEREVFISASIGIRLSGFEAASPEEMIRNADTAMYRAKMRGSGGYAIFEPDVHDRVLKRLELESDLRRAIEQEQFGLHYQPLVDLRSGGIVGVEALARWEHPERGLIGPKEFIPTAEETGLIVPLGRWVLEEACRQARAWQSEFGPLKMSVNFSLRQFQHPGLVEEVAETMRRAELESASLSLEITESVAMRETEQTVSMLRRLKELGLRLAIDDFGTGHTSLSYLIRQFRMDVLKIDRSFISKLTEDPEYEAIISGFIGLAKSLNLEVVAEGIETAGQYDLLRSMGCDTGQGFLFSKPLPGEAMSDLLSENPRW